MPIHDLGYRSWQGPLVPQFGRFWVIAQTGIRLAWRNAWLRRLVFFSWLPALYIAGLLFFYEQTQSGGFAREHMHWLQGIPITENRHQVWACLLWVFFRYPQIMVLLLVVGQIAPPLVAQDVRTKAFLLYFSRPMARLEYLLGKMVVVWTYLALISAVPALVLYVVGVFLSPDFRVVLTTWDLPLRIVGASIVLLIPTTSVALAFSSLTSETRYATFAWFAFWGVGWVAYATLMANLPPGSRSSQWALISMYHSLGTIEYSVFGLGHALDGLWAGMSSMSILPAPEHVHVWPAVLEMTIVTVVSLVILFRRISAPLRV